MRKKDAAGSGFQTKAGRHWEVWVKAVERSTLDLWKSEKQKAIRSNRQSL